MEETIKHLDENGNDYGQREGDDTTMDGLSDNQ